MGTSQAIFPVQIPKSVSHLWLWWPRASSLWQWMLDSQIPSLSASSLFLASKHLPPPIKSVSQFCTVHTQF